MRINGVVSLPRFKSGQNVVFGRKLKESEKPEYKSSLEQAFKYLGIQNRAMIIHGSSFPSKLDEDIEQSIGSPYGAEKFLDFINLHGFNAVQLGPTGKLNAGDNSPYMSSVFAKNPLFIDFAQLTTPAYASILSEDDLYGKTYSITPEKENYSRADYKDAKETIEALLESSYNGFVEKLSKGGREISALNAEFLKFQEENAYWLDDYAVLDAISKKYKTEDYRLWDKKYRDLIKGNKAGDPHSVALYKQVNEEFAREIDLYKFSQFIIDKQSKEDDKARKGTMYISDLLVGASSFDELIFEDAFLDHWKIGAKWGGQFDAPQLWGMALLNPNKLFNKDGSLGAAGKFLQMKVQKALSDAENVRIDHAMGLVDPFIYDDRSVVYGEKRDKDGKMQKYPIREKLKASYLSESKLDSKKNYQRILPDIVLPTLKEMGIDPKNVVWEDLGSDETGVFNKIFRNQNHLPGISCLEWGRGEYTPHENWSYLGSHDNQPVSMRVESGSTKNSDAWNPDYLAGYLNPSPNRAKARETFKKEILKDPKAMVKAKFADLFRSSGNIQISFMDFFGIKKPYNTPGTSSSENWTLRVNPEYEDKYYKTLEDGNEYALNMPEVLSIAVQAKADMDFAKGEKTEAQAKRESAPILKELNHFSKILKEKE